jgi:teichuronic acid exporter
MVKSLKDKTINGLLWSFIESFSLKGVQFIIEIMMARFLLPSDYGLIAMLAIFLGISRIFIDGGFSTALIQKRDRTEVDFSTVYYFNIVLSIIFYLILFFSAPFIASFYNLPELTIITRVISLNLVIASFSAVARTKLTIDVDFKTQAKVSLSAVLISGIVGIFMALNNYGVWALISQSILNTLLQSLIIFYLIRWKPMFVFSIDSFKSLFPFGSRLLISQLISTIYTNLYSLVIGKKFSSNDLGFYSRAETFSVFPASTISGVLSRVTFPILSSISNDDTRLKVIYKKYLQLTGFLVFPIMFLIIGIAYPLIEFLLTDKWLDTVMLLQILCLGFLWDPIGFLNLNLLYVKGDAKLILRLEILKKTIAIIILVISIPFGLTPIAIGRAFYSFIAVYINTHYTKKSIQLNYLTQMKLIFPYYLLALTMGILVYLSTLFISGIIFKLVIGVIFGVGYYISVAYFLKFEPLLSIIDILTKMYHQKRK